MTFDGAAEANLRAGAALTLRQRLLWNQEMGRIARRLEGARQRERASSSGGTDKPAPETDR